MTLPRQPTIERSIICACEQTAKGLSRGPASAWIHLGALAAHARLVGLTQATELRLVLAEVEVIHPCLHGLSDFAGGMTPDDERRIEALWSEHPLPVDAHWYGYALGDLYQSLSSEAREKRALCQTPYWVSELLFEVAYRRAEESWPMPSVIDPSCGTGHLLVEALDRKLSMSDPEVALAQVTGVDLDPYAAMIARYRLLVLAGVRRGFEGARDWPVRVGVADSLLDDHPLLERGQYHVVVANPPYIVPADAKQREAIRARYREVCLGKYSLALPFTVLMTELAVEGGYIAQLTTNAWMKREYGRNFVERYLPRYELVWIINSAGAYIPGHGTPTCILVHRNSPASGAAVQTVLGKRGEPKTPTDPSKGLVWSSIREAVFEFEALERFERAIARASGGGLSHGAADVQHNQATRGIAMPRGKKKTDPSQLLLPDEIAAIAEKHRKALAPLAERERKLEAELATVRARRLAVEECLLPIERVIADQRARAEAKSVAEASAFAADDVPAPTLVDSYLGAEGEPTSIPLPPWRAGA